MVRLWPRPCRLALARPERAEFQLAAVGLRVPRSDGDGLIQVLAVQDVETGDPLFGLAERPVGDKNLPAADPDGDGLAGWAQGPSGDALSPAAGLREPPLDGEVVRRGLSPGGRAWVGHDEHQVLHGPALLG